MSRRFLLAILAAALAIMRAHAYEGDDGPPIAITSPDTGTTFAICDVKTHSLVWDKKRKVLIAKVTFSDSRMNQGDFQTDYHEFRLPGPTFDEAKGVFSAATRKGDIIPIARVKKVLFFNTIELLPNAAVRILHPQGNITVVLEAIRPDDPAMHPPPSDPNGTHKVDIDKIVN